jgi:CheY-like chemotaxis protein
MSNVGQTPILRSLLNLLAGRGHGSVSTQRRYRGYEVLAATDGNDAIQVSRAHAGTIDLLLTDFNMPRLDGLSAYRQIKSERSLIKVLFMSGSDPKSSQLPPGLPFLSKPFDTASLCRKVSQLLENSARDRTDSLVSR